MTKKQLIFVGALFWIGLLAACNNDKALPTLVPTSVLENSETDTAVSPEITDSGAASTAVETATETPIPPSPTPTEPLAALVNDQPLFLVDYEKELTRYEQAAAELGGVLEESYRTAVLDALIEQILVEQAAADLGIVVTPEMVAQEIAALRSVGDFDAWLTTNLYSEAEFSEAVRKGLITEAAIAQITADVPQTAVQVHARYIHVADEVAANDLLTRAQAGDDFAFLADQFSLEPGNGGDMGWFAHGSLLVPALEEPAFALQNPGDLSNVIAVTAADGPTSYYLLQLIERDEARPLNDEMRSFILQTALADWLATLWEKAEVERLVETGS